MIEKKVNEYGQVQIIDNFDRLIKIGDKFLQVRLIKTHKFRKEGWTKPMPRAKFVNFNEENPYYLIKKEDLIRLKEK